MNLYAGLDISLEETHICIVDESGKTVRETKVATDPQAICCGLADHDADLERVGLEASSLGSWLHDELAESGFSGDRR